MDDAYQYLKACMDDLNKQQSAGPAPELFTGASKVLNNFIYCQNCGASIGPEKNFRYMVIMNDIKCPKCHAIVLRVNNGIIY